MTEVERGGGERGFTLIEIMVVVFVIASLAFVVVPRVGSGLDKMRLRTEARRLVSAMRFARARAVSRWTPHVVVLNLDEESYYIEALAPLDPVEAAAGDDEEGAPPAEEPEEAAEDDLIGRSYRLPAGVDLARFSQSEVAKDEDMDQALDSGIGLVVFEPNGSSTGGTIELALGEERQIRVQVRAISGRAALLGERRAS